MGIAVQFCIVLFPSLSRSDDLPLSAPFSNRRGGGIRVDWLLSPCRSADRGGIYRLWRRLFVQDVLRSVPAARVRGLRPLHPLDAGGCIVVTANHARDAGIGTPGGRIRISVAVP